jgi:mono/diheme cytochrome c family protein
MRICLLILLCAAIAGCPEEAPKPPPPPPVPVAPPPPPMTQTGTAAAETGGDLAAGKRLFLTACANCHGPDGTGELMRQALPKIGNLTSAEMHARLKDEDIIKLIQTGRDKMPAFGTMFPEAQLRSIVAYVRTLKRAP